MFNSQDAQNAVSRQVTYKSNWVRHLKIKFKYEYEHENEHKKMERTNEWTDQFIRDINGKFSMGL